MITYDRRAGSYRGANGQFVSKAEVLRLVDKEAAQLEARLLGHARLLVSNKISLSEFQVRHAQDLKLSHLRSAMLGSGGKAGMTSQHYGSVGNSLREQYKLLGNFGEAIASGQLSEKQILARTKSYGISTKTAFHRAEKITRQSNGFNQAKRSLDSQSNSCPDCIRYSTNGKWVPLEDVVMPGVNCRCFSQCRCQIFYRVA